MKYNVLFKNEILTKDCETVSLDVYEDLCASLYTLGGTTALMYNFVTRYTLKERRVL